MRDSHLLKLNVAITPCITNGTGTKDWQRLPFICILFMDTYAHAEQHQELPLAEASLSSHNSACCACHLLDAATNLLYISKVVTGRNSNTSLPPEGSEDPHLWQNSSINETQTCPSGRPVTSLTWSKQTFSHQLLIPLVTETQCPQ